MKKIGVNEKCHCGSNKKYKKCCLRNNGSKEDFKRNDEQLIFGILGSEKEIYKSQYSDYENSFSFINCNFEIPLVEKLNINLDYLLKNIYFVVVKKNN